MNFRISIAVIGMLVLPLVASRSAGEDNPGQRFLRLERDASKRPVSLQTAVTRYAGHGPGGTPVTVDLVGAIHLAEKSYYDELNRVFRDYDAVLYELVAPSTAAVPNPGQRSGHPVGMMQVTMKNLLGMEFQLDGINYRRPNFIHADLSPQEFARSMEQRGDSFTKLLFRIVGQGMAQQSTDPARSNDVAFLSALFSNDRAQDLKRIMAQQFEEMEKANAVIEGPKGSTIISDRNQRVAEVLEKQLRGGKRRIAIFYGAAHLPDFDKRLRTQFQLAPTEERWLEAWNLRPAPAGSPQPK